MSKRKKIIVVLGQTAVGKSVLAVRLAKRYSGEVLSADSRQVYRGLDIGTGKITKKEMRGVPHHLLDIASPNRQFTAAEYACYGRKIITDIHARGKIPIICGGTGFYIDALLGNIPLSHVPPDPLLRKKLEGRSLGALFVLIKKLDPEKAKTIDRHNRRRLIRAIEIAQPQNKQKINNKEQGKKKLLCNQRYLSDYSERRNYDVLKIGLALPDEELKRKITIRLFARIREGLVKEVKKLHKKGLSWKRMGELGLEYKYLAWHVRREISLKEVKQQLEKAIWHYAKRQKTWFKRDKKTKWFMPKDYKQIEKTVKNFLAC